MDSAFNTGFIYLAAAVLLIITSIVSRLGNSWGTPAFFFLLMWSVFIGVPLVFSPHFYISLGTMIWLLAMAVTWAMGSFVGYCIKLNPYHPYRQTGADILARRFSTRGTAVAIVFGALIGTGATVMALRDTSIQQIAGSFIIGIEEIARKNAAARYQSEYEPSILQNLCLSMAYFSAILGGLYVAANKRQGTQSRLRVVIALLPILAVAVFGVVQNTKASGIYAGSLWISGYILIISDGKNRLWTLVTPKAVITGGVVVSAFLAMFYWMQSTRYSARELSIVDSYNLLLVYGAGHLGGFSYWFDHYFDPLALGIGSNSFSMLYRLLGITDKSVPIETPKPLWEELETTVDTVFSDLIQDFGMFGSLFFVFLAAVAVTVAHRLFTRGSVLFAPLLLVFYGVTLLSFVVNLLSYTTIFAALVFFLLYLVLVQVRMRQ